MQDIVLISIPESTIRNIVEQALRKVISECPPAATADNQRLLTRKEAADVAGVCIATLDNKVKNGVLKSTARVALSASAIRKSLRLLPKLFLIIPNE
ncbi:MAG: hypothetical protein IPH31_09350 [Lewinellaceae bacterium]|nr:hypothetical protein [Lewinellaceae bacterium]